MDLGTLGCKGQKLTLASAVRCIDYPIQVNVWGSLEPLAELDPGAQGLGSGHCLSPGLCMGFGLRWPLRWLLAAPGHLFPVSTEVPGRILTGLVLVTCPSLNQSRGLGRDCAGEPDLGHMAPEPGTEKVGKDNAQQKQETPFQLDPLFREMGLLSCQSSREV